MKVIAIAGKARNGKSTVAEIFKNIAINNGETAIVLNYAGYLKYMCKTYMGWDGSKDIEGRSLLQNVGDGMRKSNGESYWIDKLMDDIKSLCSDYDYVLIDDCRYLNEILIPESMFDTYSVTVSREGFESDLTEEQKNHRSEVALNDFNFKYKISSCSGIDNLMEPVKSLYETIKRGE